MRNKIYESSIESAQVGVGIMWVFFSSNKGSNVNIEMLGHIVDISKSGFSKK